jgi:hypothetical protein
MMSEVFWTGLYSSLIGFLLAMGSQCYKSKCSSIDFCCIKIVRDIKAEVKEDLENKEETSEKNITK